jgi:hypothetical protein
VVLGVMNSRGMAVSGVRLHYTAWRCPQGTAEVVEISAGVGHLAATGDRFRPQSLQDGPAWDDSSPLISWLWLVRHQSCGVQAWLVFAMVSVVWRSVAPAATGGHIFIVERFLVKPDGSDGSL